MEHYEAVAACHRHSGSMPYERGQSVSLNARLWGLEASLGTSVSLKSRLGIAVACAYWGRTVHGPPCWSG